MLSFPASGGFGVGIFEDDDDEDVYGGGQTGFNIIIDDDEDGVFSKRLSQVTGSKSRQATTKHEEQVRFMGKMDISFCDI